MSVSHFVNNGNITEKEVVVFCRNGRAQWILSIWVTRSEQRSSRKWTGFREWACNWRPQTSLTFNLCYVTLMCLYSDHSVSMIGQLNVTWLILSCDWSIVTTFMALRWWYVAPNIYNTIWPFLWQHTLLLCQPIRVKYCIIWYEADQS